MKTFAILAALLAACNWTKFDDLSNQTWVHAQSSPDNGQSDYAVALVSTTTSGVPGALGVVSGDPSNISMLSFDATGATNETFSEPLTSLSITEISLQPVFIGDGAGDVALVERSSDGPLVAIYGSAGALVSSPPLASANPADAAIFIGSSIFVAAATSATSSGTANAFVIGDSVSNCTLLDGPGSGGSAGSAGSALDAAAITSDGTTAWVYTRGGDLVGYPLAALADDTAGGNCDDTTTSPAAFGPSIGPIATGAPAPNGGYLALDGSGHAIAVAYDSTSSTVSVGAVTMIDLSGAAAPVPVSAPNVSAAVYATFGASPTLALGFPSRSVGTTEEAGQVELHAVDPAAGTVDSQVLDLLDIPEADDDLVFGRALTAMTYNGDTILVVAANNVVYAYYETMLYDDTRQQ